MGYAPLDFLNRCAESAAAEGLDFSSGHSGLLELLQVAGERGFYLPEDEDEILRFVLSRSFLDEGYDGPFKGFNDFARLACVTTVPRVLAEMQSERERAEYRRRMEKHPETASADTKDMLVSRLIFDKWSRSKQVYKLDGTFAAVLGTTDRFTLTKSQLSHLPVDCFYLDLEDADCFGKVDGAFAFVLLNGAVTNVCLYLLSREKFYSCYLEGLIDDAGEVMLCDRDFSAEDEEIDGIRYRAVVSTALQFFSYLSVKEPDIEADCTKNTYRRPTVIRNKFSEIQRYEVGVRIGKALRQREDAWRERTGASEVLLVPEKEIRRRKSPRPYIRCAHWHRYRVGKGRTGVELRWIEPVFCGANGRDIASDIVVHKVKCSSSRTNYCSSPCELQGNQ